MTTGDGHLLIRDRLVKRGRELFDAPKKPIDFTVVLEANALLNDIATYPHAFVLACVMDRQVKAERAWLIPYKISQKIGGFSMAQLRRLSESEIRKLMTKPEPLHRFVDKMSVLLHAAIKRIDQQYEGDASRIWHGRPSSSEAVYRFLEFDGVGPKIATMAVNILAREFKVPFSDYYSIDISADVHVRRVFARLGLTGSDPTVEHVIYKARALYPQFPGIMDLPSWEIGKNWCRPKESACGECYMSKLCPSAPKS